MWRALQALAFVMLSSAEASDAAALLLELRVFNGTAEVTSHTRVTVHRAGDRGQPLAQATGGRNGIELQVPEGIYDVQAIQEQDGQVVNIQWANRLVVMPYPDEAGRHLEVLNFKNGFGALQVRAPGGSAPEVTLHSAGVQDRGTPTLKTRPITAVALKGPGYSLFVVPAGIYELTVNRGDRTTRHTDIEVPRNRTRLWLVPEEP